MLLGYALAALASGHLPDVWKPAAGVSAVALGLSSVVGLTPVMVSLAARMGLASSGRWPGPEGVLSDAWAEQVGPWLLPVTALVVLALVPRITVGRRRLSLDQADTAGVSVAALALMPLLYGAGFWVSVATLVVAAIVVLGCARVRRQRRPADRWAAAAGDHPRLCVLRRAGRRTGLDDCRPRLSRMGAHRAPPGSQSRVPASRWPVGPVRCGAVAGLRAGAPRVPGAGDRGDRIDGTPGSAVAARVAAGTRQCAGAAGR